MINSETGTEAALPSSALEVDLVASHDISSRIVHELVSELVRAVAEDDEEETAKPAIDARQHKYSR